MTTCWQSVKRRLPPRLKGNRDRHGSQWSPIRRTDVPRRMASRRPDHSRHFGDAKPANNVVPIHRSHSTDKIVGHSETITGGTKVVIKGVISADNDHSREVVGSSKNGFPWQSSVGARLLAQPDFVGEGQKVVVNGQRFKGPVFVARRWRLTEASFVSLGADGNTQAVAAEDKHMGFEAWLTARGWKKDDLSAEQLETLKAAYDAEQLAAQAQDTETSNTSQATSVAAQQAATETQARGGDGAVQLSAEDLGRIGQTVLAQVQRQQQLAALSARYPELAAQASRENWDEGRIQAETNLADLRASYSHGPAIHATGRPEGRAAWNALECGLFLSAGVGDEAAALSQYGERTVEAAAALPRAIGIRYLVHETLRAAGVRVHPVPRLITRRSRPRCGPIANSSVGRVLDDRPHGHIKQSGQQAIARGVSRGAIGRWPILPNGSAQRFQGAHEIPCDDSGRIRQGRCHGRVEAHRTRRGYLQQPSRDVWANDGADASDDSQRRSRCVSANPRHVRPYGRADA